MALLYIEGFDWFDKKASPDFCGDLQNRWTMGLTNNSAFMVSGAFGGKAFEITNHSDNIYREIVPGEPLTFGFRFRRVNSSATGEAFVAFATSAPYARRALLAFGDNGQLRWISGSNLGSTPVLEHPDPIPWNTWCYVEVRVVPATTATGSVKLGVNNRYVSVSSVSTVSVLPDRFILRAQSLAQQNAYDDFYLADSAAPGVTDVMGEVRVTEGRPTSDDFVEWDPLTPLGDHFAEVDEAVPDADGSYVQTNVVPEDDRFGHGGTGLVTGDVVRAAQVGAMWSDPDSGGPNVRLVIESNGQFAVGPATSLPDGLGVYRSWWYVVERNPDGDVAWTKAAVDAAAIGVRTA